jgi:hypothetical protein
MAEINPNNPNPVPEVQIPESRVNIQIRTQASDVESLKQTGGAHPLPETLSVNSAPLPSETNAPARPVSLPVDLSAPQAPISLETTPVVAATKRSFVWIFWLIGIIALFLVGYYLLPLFFK